ncbi:MAG: response regulator transcription factor [Chloroflexota bacterium]
MSPEVLILVVDDEQDLADNISLALTAAGYRVLTAGNGGEAIAILQTERVDLILADIAMPGMNGYQLYEQMRENPNWTITPFIFLTARNMDSDIRFGKELGVDDYLTKPIHSIDLLAVVRGKLRRARQLAYPSNQAASKPTSEPGRLVAGALQINIDQHRVWLADHEIYLSAREFTLLKYLAQQTGQLVSPQELVQITHNLETDAIEAGNLMRPLIRSLRRKLGYHQGEMGCLENVRGVGYRLVAPS